MRSSSIICKSFLSASVAALFLSTALAANVEIDWVIPADRKPYPDQVASAGTTVNFAWTTGIHNVYIHPSGSCAEEGSILVSNASGATFTFDETHVGTTVVFACDVGTHCEFGQIVSFVVSDGKDTMTTSGAHGNMYSSAIFAVAVTALVSLLH